MDVRLEGRCLVPGQASGEVLYSEEAVSFWMGTDTRTGAIVDSHHPDRGRTFAGKILVIPGGRGSCGGSIALLEMILAGTAPAALVLAREDYILAAGSIIADELLGKSIPIVGVGPEGFTRLRGATHACVVDGHVTTGAAPGPAQRSAPPRRALKLSSADQAMLDGAEGEARALAMRIVVRVAEVQQATQLVDVTQGHIDSCFYTGPAGLAVAEKLADLGGRVKVPATTNAASVDARRWRSLGVDREVGETSDRVVAAYVRMGVEPTFTCAPYLLDGAPRRGDRIAWGESNAVAYANSVIGAHTMKYPDLFEVCVALTGRAPLADCYVEDERLPVVRIDVAPLDGLDDSFWPLLGHHVGELAGGDIPVVTGLEARKPTTDDLKAFSAAFATTGSASMYHIAGVTPEAAGWTRDSEVVRGLNAMQISKDDLAKSWQELNSAQSEEIRVVALGNPHFSPAEWERLAALCAGRVKHASVAITITTGRATYDQAKEKGWVGALEAFGATVLTDTCWCMFHEPVLPPARRGVITNSAKYAHYGPGLIGEGMRFGSLAECVEAACTGRAPATLPRYLSA